MFEVLFLQPAEGGPWLLICAAIGPCVGVISHFTLNAYFDPFTIVTLVAAVVLAIVMHHLGVHEVMHALRGGAQHEDDRAADAAVGGDPQPGVDAQHRGVDAERAEEGGVARAWRFVGPLRALFIAWLILFVVFYRLLQDQLEESVNLEPVNASVEEQVAFLVELSGKWIVSLGTLCVQVFVIVFVVVFVLLFSWQVVAQAFIAQLRR